MADTAQYGSDAVTQDAFLGGRVHLFQPRDGFRAGTDSILLAASLPATLSGIALELGSGAGGALFCAAYRLAEMQFFGLEKDPHMLQLALQGVAANGLSERVQLVTGDAGALAANWQNKFDLVFSNPPFFDAARTQAPHAAKSAAYLESISLKDWLQAMLFATRPKGHLVVIHRAAELARILAVIERQAGEICVRPVHSYPGADAKRIIIRARKGLRPGPLRLLEPVYLYKQKGGERTDWAFKMQSEGAGLTWR